MRAVARDGTQSSLSGRSPEARLRSWQRPTVLIGLVGIAGLGARLMVLAGVGEPPDLHGDEVDYVHAARSLLGGEGYPGSARPPGWPFLLSLVWRVFGPTLTAGRITQLLLSLLVALLICDWARRAYGPRAGLLSGLLCALHPTLASYGLFFWAEPLFAALLVLAFWSLYRFLETEQVRWVCLSGGALGLAALTRELVLYFVPLALLWLWRRRAGGPHAPARWLAPALLAGGVLLTVLPWSARNTARQGQVVLVSTIRWLPVALGNLLPEDGSLLSPASDEDLVHRYLAIPDEPQREAYARRVALAAVAREQPAWILRKMVRNGYLLFRPQSQLRKFLRSGWLAPDRQGPAAVLVAVEAVFYVAGMGLGLVALWRVRADPMKGLVVAYVVFTCALHVVANANHRFRFPLLPFLALYTGPLLLRQLGPNSRLRAVGLTLSLIAFAAIVGADLVQGG